jgi:hypothetical protein
MGFSNEASRLALQQSNNSVSHSVHLIQEQPSLLNVASTSQFKVKKEMLQQVFSAACYETFPPHIMHVTFGSSWYTLKALLICNEFYVSSSLHFASCALRFIILKTEILCLHCSALENLNECEAVSLKFNACLNEFRYIFVQESF